MGCPPFSSQFFNFGLSLLPPPLCPPRLPLLEMARFLCAWKTWKPCSTTGQLCISCEACQSKQERGGASTEFSKRPDDLQKKTKWRERIRGGKTIQRTNNVRPVSYALMLPTDTHTHTNFTALTSDKTPQMTTIALSESGTLQRGASFMVT